MICIIQCDFASIYAKKEKEIVKKNIESPNGKLPRDFLLNRRDFLKLSVLLTAAAFGSNREVVAQAEQEQPDQLIYTYDARSQADIAYQKDQAEQLQVADKKTVTASSQPLRINTELSHVMSTFLPESAPEQSVDQSKITVATPEEVAVWRASKEHNAIQQPLTFSGESLFGREYEGLQMSWTEYVVQQNDPLITENKDFRPGDILSITTVPLKAGGAIVTVRMVIGHFSGGLKNYGPSAGANFTGRGLFAAHPENPGAEYIPRVEEIKLVSSALAFSATHMLTEPERADSNFSVSLNIKSLSTPDLTPNPTTNGDKSIASFELIAQNTPASAPDCVSATQRKMIVNMDHTEIPIIKNIANSKTNELIAGIHAQLTAIAAWSAPYIQYAFRTGEILQDGGSTGYLNSLQTFANLVDLHEGRISSLEFASPEQWLTFKYLEEVKSAARSFLELYIEMLKMTFADIHYLSNANYELPHYIISQHTSILPGIGLLSPRCFGNTTITAREAAASVIASANCMAGHEWPTHIDLRHRLLIDQLPDYVEAFDVLELAMTLQVMTAGYKLNPIGVPVELDYTKSALLEVITKGLLKGYMFAFNDSKETVPKRSLF